MSVYEDRKSTHLHSGPLSLNVHYMTIPSGGKKEPGWFCFAHFNGRWWMTHRQATQFLRTLGVHSLNLKVNFDGTLQRNERKKCFWKSRKLGLWRFPTPHFKKVVVRTHVAYVRHILEHYAKLSQKSLCFFLWGEFTDHKVRLMDASIDFVCLSAKSPKKHMICFWALHGWPKNFFNIMQQKYTYCSSQFLRS